MCHFEMHTKATKSWNALKRQTGEWRVGAWLAPAMQKIRCCVLEYMNTKGARLSLCTFRNCHRKKSKCWAMLKRCICSSLGDCTTFPGQTSWCCLIKSSLPLSYGNSLEAASQVGEPRVKSMSSGPRLCFFFFFSHGSHLMTNLSIDVTCCCCC